MAVQPDHKLFRELSKEFSLIRLYGKDPSRAEGKGWQKYCHTKRDFNGIGFKSEHNAGIACGPASGVIVVDVDDVPAFEKWLEHEGLSTPPTRTHQTGSGKFHLLYQYPNSNGTRYGCRAFNQPTGERLFDIKGIGGQVVAPGSIHPDTGKPYTVAQDIPMAPAPKWLLRLASGADRQNQGSTQSPTEGIARQGWDGDLDSLPISKEKRDLIQRGLPRGQRSEAILGVCNALVWANLSDAEIFSIFSEYPIGEKWRNQHKAAEKWLQGRIDKARAYVKDRANSQLSNTDETEGWEYPTDLTTPIPPAPQFPLNCLPYVAANYAEDEAERMQCPVDLIAIPMIVAFAGLIGKEASIRPKARDDWSERACLWGALIADVSAMKSPALTKATAPLRRIQVEWAKQDEAKLGEWQKLSNEFKLREQAWKKECEALLKREPDAQLPPKPQIVEDLPPKPTQRWLLTNDSTIEKLADLMSASRGMSLIRDELAGFCLNMARYNQGSDRQFYLECYSGNAYTVHRIGRGDQYIDDLYLNLFGGIQPSVAKKLFSAETGTDDGFFERFGLITYPEPRKDYQHVDRWPDRDKKALFNDMCDRLANAEWLDILHRDEFSQKAFARFSGEAQTIFDDWLVEHMRNLASLEKDDPLAKRMGKARGLLVRVTLVLHLAAWAAREMPDPKTIEIESLLRALGLLEDYLIPMWTRIQAAFGETAVDHSVHKIAKWIRKERLEELRFREVRRKGWAGLSSQKEIESAIEMLVAHQWLSDPILPELPKGGRPSPLYLVNPLVHSLKGEQ